MSTSQDGPRSRLFWPLPFEGGQPLPELTGLSDEMSAARQHAPSGECVSWGIPFTVDKVVLIHHDAVTINFGSTTARWLVFLHTSDLRKSEPGPGGFWSPMRGEGQLAEHAADYVLLYQDGTEERAAICRRHQIGMFHRLWDENCFEAGAHHKPRPMRASHEQLRPFWGVTQTRADAADDAPWVNWLWAWENPHPDKVIVGVRLEPVAGLIIVSAISAGNAASSGLSTSGLSTSPLRWQTRRKAVLTLPEGESFRPDLDEHGLLNQIQLDLGQVISATPRLVYPNDAWLVSKSGDTYNNQLPQAFRRWHTILVPAHDAMVLIEHQVEFDHVAACGAIVPCNGYERLDTGPPVDNIAGPTSVRWPGTNRVSNREWALPERACRPIALRPHSQVQARVAPG